MIENTMIKTTLMDAINRVRKNGGRADRIDGGTWFNEKTISDFRWVLDDFDMTWIYEPTKRSAFQEWELKTGLTKNMERFIGRKEGWNGAVEYIEKKYFYECGSLSPIKHLKED